MVVDDGLLVGIVLDNLFKLLKRDIGIRSLVFASQGLEFAGLDSLASHVLADTKVIDNEDILFDLALELVKDR